MNCIQDKEIKRFLSGAREVGKSNKLFDVHVHPFEILSNMDIQCYQKVSCGTFGTSDCIYKKPTVSSFSTESNSTDKELIKKKFGVQSAFIKLRRIYRHVGPDVLNSHMSLCGISQNLFLLVALPCETIHDQLKMIDDIYIDNDKFFVWYCIPNSVCNDDIKKHLGKYINNKVIALKLHPNITEIDMARNSGIERVEHILSAANEYGLPLFIHSGRSYIIKNRNAQEYGIIANFKNIDWNLSKQPVVISHAGAYGYSVEGIRRNVLPALKKLISKYDNIMVDTSGLNIQQLVTIFKHLDPHRIMFGSDALYYPQWKAMVSSLYAMKTLQLPYENFLIQIANINPMKYVFRR